MIVKVIHTSYGLETCKTLVASVTLEKITDHDKGLEFAYMKTQNINDSWSNSIHPANVVDWRVKVEAPLHEEDGETFGLRSSMTGDRFQVIDPENYDSDLFYVCAMIGFDPCDPFDYRVKGVRESDGEETSYIVQNPSNNFYKNGGSQGLDYVE